jgi:hypothetical protein
MNTPRDKSVVAHVESANHLPSPQSYGFEQIHRMATAFAKSGLFGVKDPDQALALMLYAQASGRHPALIMRDYDVIQGRLAKKSETMLRDFQASGGRVQWTKYADEGVTGVFTHPLSATPVTIDWDMERAKKAGLAGKDGGMYTKYTRAMFRSRCISEGVRTTAPDATEQMYTAEEMRSMSAEELPEPITVEAAVVETAKQAKSALPPDEVEALIQSMDVKTIAELTPAFGRAYTRAKEVGDEAAKKKFKDLYDGIKTAIEAEQIP